MESILLFLMKMAKRLKNRIPQESYLPIFQKVIISMHIYITFSDRPQQCLSENILYYEGIFCILNTNEEKPLKILISISIFHNIKS